MNYHAFKKLVYVNKVKMLVFFSSVVMLCSIFSILKKINFFIKSFVFTFSRYSSKKAKKQFIFKKTVIIWDSFKLLREKQRVLNLYCKNRNCRYSKKDIYRIKGKNFKEALAVYNSFWAIPRLVTAFIVVTHDFMPKTRTWTNLFAKKLSSNWFRTTAFS